MKPQEVIEKYGTCLELISMDPFFHEITVGLFLKDSTLTVHSYRNKDGVKERLTQIRDRIVLFGGAKPLEGSSCGFSIGVSLILLLFNKFSFSSSFLFER